MRLTLAVAVVAVLGAGGVVASEPKAGPPPARSHVRCLTPEACVLVEDATRRSPVVRSFVALLDRSDVTVYISLLSCSKRDDPLSYLVFVGSGGDMRYVQVLIDPWRTVPVERTWLLGHELYHALEIAQDPTVRDAGSLRALYRRIGHEYGAGRFETDSARRAGERVRQEVTSPR